MSRVATGDRSRREIEWIVDGAGILRAAVTGSTEPVQLDDNVRRKLPDTHHHLEWLCLAVARTKERIRPVWLINRFPRRDAIAQFQPFMFGRQGQHPEGGLVIQFLLSAARERQQCDDLSVE
jgi:hypothetical protein